jgi:tetratricopeptide (TPR) repeat protein
MKGEEFVAVRIDRLSRSLGAFLAVLVGASAAVAAPQVPDTRIQATVTAIDAALEAHDCTKVIEAGDALLSGRRGKVDPSLRTAVEGVVAACEYDGGAKEKVYALALARTRGAEGSDSMWRLRLFAEIDTKRYAAAVATIEAIGAQRPAVLNEAPMDWMFRLNRELKETGRKAERRRLLGILAADTYVPTESSGDTQGLRYAYAELLAEAGEPDAARAALAVVSDPDLLADALFDPRLAPLLPANLDLRGAAEAALAKDRTLAEGHPDRLDPVIAIAADLRRIGRAGEVLALLRPLLASDTSRFGDVRRKLPWVWDEVGRAETALGHYDEAVKAFTAGMSLDEGGEPNVSQVINLAAMQVRFRHPEAALKTLAVFDDPKRRMSPYGNMEMRLARGCAHADLGHAAAAGADLAYAQAHPKDHPEALGDLYLCLGRMDDAAAFYIGRLADPETRVHALKDLSDYDPPPGPLPPLYAGRWDALKARPDVRAAAAKAGGTRRIPLQAPVL